MSISVFLADDHAIIREGLTSLLTTDTGINVLGSAANGREAVTQIHQLNPAVAILDISMPDMNGIEAARQIRERSPQVHILILSMHSTATHVFQALEAGVHGYMLKESAAQEIIHAVRMVHAGRRFLSSSVVEVVAENLHTRSDINPLDSLSKREREILQLVAEGHSSAQIAKRLNLSSKTVDTYRSRLMQKLGLKDVGGIVRFALQRRLISLD
jgi:DNA-binding NarL/FixJ family response regulator